MRIYVDLDETLIANDVDPWSGIVRRIYARPGAHEFLSHLQSYGQVWLLTRAEMGHVDRALQKLGDAAELLKGIISREDLTTIYDQVEAILEAPISDTSKLGLLSRVKPLFPRGIIFDNDEPYSDSYWIKTKAVGVGFDQWIEVDPFTVEGPDLGGLERAFSKFLSCCAGRPMQLSGVHAYA